MSNLTHKAVEKNRGEMNAKIKISLKGTEREVGELIGAMIDALPEPFHITYSLMGEDYKTDELLELDLRGDDEWAELSVRRRHLSDSDIEILESEYGGYLVIGAFSGGAKTILVRKVNKGGV